MAWINQAKATLHIAYGHTSHGSQITDGMTGLAEWKGSLYAWNRGGTGGALDLDDGGSGGLPDDVGYYPDWVNATRSFLGTPNPSTGRGNSHPNVNVIMWSWCGQAAGYSAQDMLDQYLTPMSSARSRLPGRHVRLHDGSPGRHRSHGKPEPAQPADPRLGHRPRQGALRLRRHRELRPGRARQLHAARRRRRLQLRRRQLVHRLAERRTSEGVDWYDVRCGAQPAPEREPEGLRGLVAVGAARGLERQRRGAEHHDQRRDRQRGRAATRSSPSRSRRRPRCRSR